jgi:hypothetical protein
MLITPSIPVMSGLSRDRYGPDAHDAELRKPLRHARLNREAYAKLQLSLVCPALSGMFGNMTTCIK